MTIIALLLASACAQERTSRYLNRNIKPPLFQPTSILVNPQPIGSLSFPEPIPHVHDDSELILSKEQGHDSTELKALYESLQLKELMVTQGILFQKSLGRLSCLKTLSEPSVEFECHVSAIENNELQKMDRLIYVSMDVEEITIPGLKETRRFQKSVGAFYCLKSIEMGTGDVEYQCGVNSTP